MTPRTILLQRPLASRWISGILGVVAVVVIGAFAMVINATSTSPQATLWTALSVWVVILAFSAQTFWSIRVYVEDVDGHRDLVVEYGSLVKFRQRFRANQIVDAQVVTVSFLQSGGFGYRGSIRLIRRAALATRRGEALRLSLQRGRVFIVTVDDAAEFVALLAK
jgi:hypothetical protein